MKAKKKKEEEKQLQKYITNIINFTLHLLAVPIDNENVQSNIQVRKYQKKQNDSKLSILHL